LGKILEELLPDLSIECLTRVLKTNQQQINHWIVKKEEE